MKKVGIITILKVNNYGAELQAYALQRKLCTMGYQAEIIDYLFYKHPEHRNCSLSRPFVRHSLKKNLLEFLYPCWMGVKTFPFRSAARLRAERFAQFHRENTHFSLTYRSMAELYQNAPVYDVYMTGSDQVWNPGIWSSVKPYLLTFVPEGGRRVAYAASFGVKDLPREAVDEYRKALLCYARIGMREASGAELVRQLCGKTAEVVLDPTLLLDETEWQKVEDALEVPKSYLLIYEVTANPMVGQIAARLAQKLNLSIVRVCRCACPESRCADEVNILDAGPAEFIYLMRHAAYVVTNSFHGIAFAVNFKRKFSCVMAAHKNNNSRQENLLEDLGLRERLLYDVPVDLDICTAPINYDDVARRLFELRKRSESFLRDAINND